MKRRTISKGGKKCAVVTKTAAAQTPPTPYKRNEFESAMASCVLHNLLDQLETLEKAISTAFLEAKELARMRSK